MNIWTMGKDPEELGVINQKGIQAPYSKEICDPIRDILEREGIGMVEKVL